MSFGPSQQSPLKKRFIIRERSLSSLPSRNLSVANLNAVQQNPHARNNQSKQSAGNLLSYKTTRLQHKRDSNKGENFDDHFNMSVQVLQRDEEIIKLKRKLDTAVNLAINEKMQASNTRQQIFKDKKTREWFENKIKELQSFILKERNHKGGIVQENSKLKETVQSLQQKVKDSDHQYGLIEKDLEEAKQQVAKIPHLELLIKDQEPLTNRIKVLEEEIRIEKLKIKDNSKVIRNLEKENGKLNQEIRRQKPQKQELQQKILYWERVNLDLSRKMQDYDKRENQYIKQANANRRTINKLLEEKAQLEKQLQQTCQKLEQKTEQCTVLAEDLKQKKQRIQELQISLKKEQQMVTKLHQQIKEIKDFYKSQQQQNKVLKRRNKVLQEHEYEMQHSIQVYQKINEEVNLTIVSRIQEINKLNAIIKQKDFYTKNIQQKYRKFDTLFEPQNRTEKGDTEIQEFYFRHIRENLKLNVTIKELKAELDEKILKFGEQRDTFNREKDIRKPTLPDDDNLFEVVFHEKKQELILLEGSNDQLIKIKKDLEARIIALETKLQDEKKENLNLKLKASQVFKARKEVQESRKTLTRYQQMIEELKQSIVDYESQLTVLRQKTAQMSEKNFQLDLDNRNYQAKIKELEAIMVEIDAQTLVQRKNENDKNAHMIKDAIDKLQNGIKSLSLYFSCSFCGDLPTNPVTLANCGHTYCQKQKCKEAYAEYCFECDSGLPIEKSFVNKYMKYAMGKFSFFKMVIEEVTINLAKKKD